MSNDKKDFFDYDSYVSKKTGNGKKNGKKTTQDKQDKHDKHNEQKPPKFVPADEKDRYSAKKTAKKQDKDSIENIKRMFDEALDESHEEMAEFTEEIEGPAEKRICAVCVPHSHLRPCAVQPDGKAPQRNSDNGGALGYYPVR